MIARINDMGIIYCREDVTCVYRAHIHTVHVGFDGWRDMPYGFRKSMHTYSIYFVSRKVLR